MFKLLTDELENYRLLIFKCFILEINELNLVKIWGD